MPQPGLAGPPCILQQCGDDAVRLQLDQSMSACSKPSKSNSLDLSRSRITRKLV